MTQLATVINTDAELEARIRRAQDAYIKAGLAEDFATARMHWVLMQDLIAQRSPQQVARMERDLGLMGQ